MNRDISALNVRATVESNMENIEALFNGIERETYESKNYLVGTKGSTVRLILEKPQSISGIRLVFDSDLNRETLPERERRMDRNMLHNIPLGLEPTYPPKTLIRDFTIRLILENGDVETHEIRNYHQRLF